MDSLKLRFAALLLLTVTFGAVAEPAHEGHHSPAWKTYGPHHLSVIVGGTYIDGEGTAETLGLDYEYRITDLVGVGAIFEHAAGEIDANTTLVVVDLHPFPNEFILQLGLGVESPVGEGPDDIFVGRVGMLYEFEFEQYSISPQLHWDYHDGHHNALVFGVAFGVAF
jgi:hypothetical protein